ncbi:hypothetical protein CICLE_v10024644mg [Citrus x clementina]|uniref:Uncharacterized protein n=1 Tax=Citrus clementina TaxID=85681 RepID=V4TZI8_CITCL|nr:hypothetical protein CICLE_v10024644mg [Citrus x clementina]
MMSCYVGWILFENCLLSGMLMMTSKGFSISMTTILYLEMAWVVGIVIGQGLTPDCWVQKLGCMHISN